jgi:hypothetical protein
LINNLYRRVHVIVIGSIIHHGSTKEGIADDRDTGADGTINPAGVRTEALTMVILPRRCVMSNREIKNSCIYLVPVLFLACSGAALAAESDAEVATSTAAVSTADDANSPYASTSAAQEPVDCFYEANQSNALCVTTKTPDQAPSAAHVAHGMSDGQF